MQFPINSVQDLDKISSAVKWQYFEKLVAFIFEQNGFMTAENIIVKDGLQKRQFDVIAKRYGTTYLVECKKWKGKQRMNVGPAARKHLERCGLYAQVHQEKIVPLIVTLIDDGIETADGIIIVPIIKLNAWINEEL
ncbi:MAG TPA: restriction endonuclease [archaeon]|nr:restriction endonuclease [archaeon]